MSRNQITALMTLAVATLVAAGAALWLGTRQVVPLPAPAPLQPEWEAALAQLDRAQSGEAAALPELRRRLLALAELQDRAGEPLRVEAILQGLAGRIEGTLATRPVASPPATFEAALPLAALGVGALGLLGLLLAARRRPATDAAPPGWSEGLRAEVQAALDSVRQAQEEAARAASRAGDQQERLAHRVRLLFERLETPPAGEADPRLSTALDRMETLGATLGQLAGRAEATLDREAQGLERLEVAVDNLHALPSEPGPLATLLPAFENAAAECRATAPLLGELASLAQQAMARVTEEAVVQIGVAADRVPPLTSAEPSALPLDRLEALAARLEEAAATAHAFAGLPAEVARVAALANEMDRVAQGLGSVIPVADLAAQVDRVTAAAIHVQSAAERLESGLPVLELTTQIARMDAAAGAVEQAAGKIPVADMAGQMDRLTTVLATQLAQVTDGVAALEQGARQMLHALPVESLAHQVGRLEALVEGGARLGETARELAGAAAAVREAGAALESSARAMPDVRATLAPILSDIQATLPARAAPSMSRRAPDLPAPHVSLAQVEAEVAQLLDEAEGLAAQAAPRPGEAWPSQASGRVGQVLDSIQATIDRLQAVATALALAADLPGQELGEGEARGAA